MVDPQRHVITGIGLAAPSGRDPDRHFAALSRGQPLFKDRGVFGERWPAVPAGCVDDADHGVPRRVVKKIDRFSLLALMAARGALTDAKVHEVSGLDERVGMVIGNATGGWSFVEPMMYGLFTEGMSAINAYVATAWFPAAPQGEISIWMRLAGYSKTVSADRISAGFAVQQALRSLRAGRGEIMLAGGAEAPLSALITGAHAEAHGQDSPPLGEGAALVVIESAEGARARGKEAYAEIKAAESGADLGAAIRKCLSSSGVRPDEVDLVLLGSATAPEVSEEIGALREVLGDRRDLRISAPRTMYGDLLGAAMAVDVASASLCLSRQCALPSAAGTQEADSRSPFRHVIGAAEPCRLRHVLVNGRDHDGRGFAVLLGEAASGAKS